MTTASNRKRVLIVDNLDINLELYRQLFRDVEFYDVDFAISGYDAVEMFRIACDAREPYDLILLDIAMPGMDGFETAEQIRERFDKDCRSHIIFLSAYAGRDLLNMVRAKHLKADLWQREKHVTTLRDDIEQELERLESV
jgi:CheY-like chemotaxis protein